MHVSFSERYAVIDVGTHSVLMLVCDVGATTGACEVVLDSKKITRLGQGLADKKELQAEAMERTCVAIREYVRESKLLGVQKLLAVGTSALREAANASHFLRRVRDCCNIEIETLSGETEARCSYLAIRDTPDFWRDDVSGLMVVDIGGGSTEVAFGAQDIISVLSVNAGSVYLTESFLKHDPPTLEELEALDDFLQDAWQSKRILSNVDHSSTALVGVGGTIVNLASVKLRLNRFDAERLHGAVIDRVEIMRQIERFCAVTLAARKELRGLEKQRAESIIAGAMILQSFLGHVGASQIRANTHGLRYGVMYHRFCPEIKCCVWVN